ncbi:MAG: Amuc_1098 family type IV pilus outer membrane protein [Luteolibacter sp.]|uniref:Amuc_1098 family type IV pilus outer membrane protein n=1 Tax=Luteolibacter sp. TaxID=1962973 RepID=UPI0032665685
MYRSSRSALALMAVASSMPATVTVATAGEGGSSLSGLAQREMIRRQDAVTEADALLAEGRAAYAKGDYQQAVDKYKQALDRLPDAPMVSDRRQSYTAHYADASVALAMQHRKVGKYPEARTLLEGVLAVDSENADAKRELGYLDDPIRTNPALTYEHTQNIDKVRRGLYTAEGNFNLGKYDDAKREYENVIRIDPYNSAARRGLEHVAQSKSDYYRAAYDHTRAELLSQVDAAWELSVPPDAPVLGPDNYGKDGITDGVAYITEKLRRIVVPRIDFEDTTVEEAIDFLRLRASELDTTELDPTKKGVNFVIRRPRPSAVGAADAGTDPAAPGAEASLPGPASDPGALRVHELRLRNVPLAVALKYICDQTKLRYKVDDFAVTLVPQTETGEDIFTRTFHVPPDFNSSLSGGDDGGGAAADADPFADTAASGGAAKLTARPPILDLLKRAGIAFSENTSATLSNSGVLLVTNTPSELDKVEQLVQTMVGNKPKQVKITTKFVEISQENNDELGFDWLIAGVNLSNTVFANGGTIGNQAGRTANDFISPVNGTSVDGIPAGPAQFVDNVSTNGLRSGDQAINRNSIDAILNNPNRTAQRANVAPGIAALTGLFSDGQVQMIMRGLAQKKGTDLMTAPSVTAKSGQKATIEIIREFIYPTEYEPPELPNSTGSTVSGGLLGGGGFGGGGGSSFPVTPATPTAFDTRNTGVTLEIEPTIAENDFVIDLRFVPEIVEFEGFINYGSPIQSPSTDALGNPVTSIITENRIEMPVFSARRVNTALTIYDGYTVAVGGLIREDVQNIEDKVPILGDIPIIGRLFQSKSENHIKSNLIIFVTAQIIDATGRPLRGADAIQQVPVSTGGAGAGDAGMLPPLPGQ